MKCVDQRRDRHPEGDVYTHIKVVTDRVAVHCDIDVSLAALFHDLGKDRTTEINPKTGMPRSPGHQRYSAQCVSIWSDWIRQMGGTPHVVHSLVYHHMDKDLAGLKHPRVSPKRMAWLKEQPWWDKLKKLMDADYGGTDVEWMK